MSYEKDNIFALILSGKIPCDKVFEDDHVLAFKDLTPKAPVHIMIIPKGEYSDSYDFGKNASDEEIIALNRAISKIAADEGVVEEGYRIISNCKKNAGQEVPHYHMHLLAGKPMGPILAI